MGGNSLLAVIGLPLIVPACLLVLSWLLGFSVPDTLIHPVVVLGGLGSVMAANFFSVAQVRGQRSGDCVVGSVTIRVGGRRVNLAVFVLSFVLTAIIAGYLLVENFQSR